MIVQLDSRSISFPPPATALPEPNGLLAVGGDLSPARLMHAYRHGIFPWFSDEDPILWWSPQPRAVFYPEQVHVSRSLIKAMRKHDWRITINHEFEQVIEQCATLRADTEGTWITEPMHQAYTRLHRLGHAHSVEVWLADQLVGGLYGISVGQAFWAKVCFIPQLTLQRLLWRVLPKSFNAMVDSSLTVRSLTRI